MSHGPPFPFQPPLWLPPLRRALEQIEAEGYVVGGAVRDLLLGYPPTDWDVLVRSDALAEAEAFVAALRVALAPAPLLAVGESFAGYKVKLADTWLDLIVPVDAAGVQRPDLPLEADLLRRDFTVNALALPLQCLPPSGSARARLPQLLQECKLWAHPDLTGLQDLEAGRLRAVGDARARLAADPLRILRAARFYAGPSHGCKGLQPDPELTAAARELAGRLSDVSPERVWRELLRLLAAPHAARGLRWLEGVGALEVLLPAWAEVRGIEQHNPYHHATVSEHILEVVEGLDEVDAPPLTKLAGLLHDIGKGRTCTLTQTPEGLRGHFYRHEDTGADMAREWLRQMRAGVGEARTIERLVRLHMRPNAACSRKAARRLTRDAGHDLDALLQLWRADRLAHAGATAEATDAHIAAIYGAARELPRTFSDHDLALSGHDLMGLGLSGSAVGEAKRRLAAAVVDDEVPNEAAALRQYLKQEFPL